MTISKQIQVATRVDSFDESLVFVVQQVAENQIESPNVTIQAILAQGEVDGELVWVPGFNVIVSGEVKPQCDPVPVG